MSSNATAGKRILKEVREIKKYNEENPNAIKFIVDRSPYEDGEEDSECSQTEKDDHREYFIILGRILPQSDMYNKSAYRIKLRIPTTYPFQPPEVLVVSPIHHPNIVPKDKLCLRLLRSWKSTNSLFHVIDAIIEHIDKPNLDDPDSRELADEYRNNRAEFERKVNDEIKKERVARQ